MTVRHAWTIWAWTLTSAALTTAGLMSLIAAVPEAPALALSVPTQPCSEPPAFRSGYETEPGSVVPQGDGFALLGNGWVEATVCKPGVLRITAHGDAGGENEPRLDITVNSRWLQSAKIRRKVTLEVDVPVAGRVILAYLNDYYRSEVRLANLENALLRFATDLSMGPGYRTSSS